METAARPQVVAPSGGAPTSVEFPSALDPCLKSNFTPNINCINPVTHQIMFDKFLFWDHIHPTGVVQAAWSAGLIAAVPGPPTLALFAVALAAFRFARRRRGA